MHAWAYPPRANPYEAERRMPRDVPRRAFSAKRIRLRPFAFRFGPSRAEPGREAGMPCAE